MPFVDHSGTQNVGDYVRLLGNGFLVERIVQSAGRARGSVGTASRTIISCAFVLTEPIRGLAMLIMVSALILGLIREFQ